MEHGENLSNGSIQNRWKVTLYALLAFAGGIIVCFLGTILALMFLSYGREMWSVLFSF